MKNTNSPILVAIQCFVYNHELYLRDCLNGFVMQQTNFRFVAIVHDDVSTDHSADIIREYAEKYPEIICPIYERENQFSKHDGSLEKVVGDAIVATGAKYVAMCEGDDYWIDPHKLQKQVDYMEAHPDCSCCAHNSLRLTTQTREIGLFNTKYLHTLDYTLETFITKNWFTPTQSLLYRRNDYQAFEDMPGFLHGDYSLLINILLKKGTYLHYENEIMAVYRSGGWATTHYNELKLWDDFIALLKYYKLKSDHRCDVIFDKLIEREEKGKSQSIKYQADIKKSRSLFVRANHWLSRMFANIANVHVKCIHVTKKVEYDDLPTIETLD